MAARRTALVTGSSGLIGSEMAAFLDARGWRHVDEAVVRTGADS